MFVGSMSQFRTGMQSFHNEINVCLCLWSVIVKFSGFSVKIFLCNYYINMFNNILAFKSKYIHNLFYKYVTRNM